MNAPVTQLPDLQQALARLSAQTTPAQKLDHLIHAGVDRLALPAAGATLGRWQALAAVAAHDLSLAKLFEGHTDALAILTELGANPSSVTPIEPAGRPQSWAVWAAEMPSCRVVIEAGNPQPGALVSLSGTKAWCSGARSGTHALLTAWSADGTGPHLVAVALAQPHITVSSEHWQAVGMRASESLRVSFDQATGRLVGTPGSYLARPGFWHGGAGVAACWYGGTLAIAGALQQALARTNAASTDRFRLAAAGRVDVALHSTAQLFRQTAAWLDNHPREDARPAALRLRLAAAACAQQVLALTGDAMGAAPFCLDKRFAQAAADLPVFIRQNHGDNDYAALGEWVSLQGSGLWQL